MAILKTKEIAEAFDELNLAQVHAVHATKNPNSGRVLEKIGMRPVGISADMMGF